MTREDIENNVGYWQGKANLEYIRQRQEHGINDPYMIIEIDEAFDAGFDKGYQYAVDKACELIEKLCDSHNIVSIKDGKYKSSSWLEEQFRKAMEE